MLTSQRALKDGIGAEAESGLRNVNRDLVSHLSRQALRVDALVLLMVACFNSADTENTMSDVGDDDALLDDGGNY